MTEKNIVLTGTKIKLEPTHKNEIDLIMEFEKNNHQYVGEYSKEKHLKLLSDPNCLHFIVKHLENNRPVGHAIIFGINDPHKVLEFRRLTISEKGKGYGREVLQLIKQYCFKQLKHHRLWLDVYNDNPRAFTLYESEGFKLDGLLRENVKTENGYRSQRIYSILENEYFEK